MLNTAHAQQKEGNEDALLPEIDPQDIEIRSQFKAQFPGLRRQPILGFEPTPQTYQIDPNHTPYIEDRDQAVADLSVSKLNRPNPPAYTPLHYSPKINAFARAGIGSYLSPEAQFWGVHRISNKTYVGGNLDYQSSDGHLDNQASSFRFLDANAQFVTKLNKRNKLSINGGYNNSFNQMPDFSGIVPRKEYSGFQLGAAFNRHQNTVTGFTGTANIRYFNADLNNAGTTTEQTEERVYTLGVTKNWAGAQPSQVFTVQAELRGGNYENKTQSSAQTLTDDWLTASGGVGYKQLFNYSTHVSADLQVFYTQNFSDDKVYLGPSLTIKQPIADILTIKLRGSARPEMTTLEEHHNTNRFLGTDDPLRHSYNINGLAEAKVDYSQIGSLRLGVQYQHSKNNAIYAREKQLGGPATGFSGIHYLDTHRIRAYAAATHQLVPEKLWLDGKFYWQSPKLESGGRTPYKEKVGLNATARAKFFNKLTLELWGDYVGSRKTYNTNKTLDGYVLMGSRTEYSITKNIGAYLKFTNIFNQDYQVWQGYTERPFQVFGGLTIKF